MTRFLFISSVLISWVVLGSPSDSTAQSPTTEESHQNKWTETEQLLMAVQQICPVSGQQLGSHGEPVKVKIGEQHAFLCCNACMSQKLNAKHWQAVLSNFATAQKTCPIMDKPVSPKMKTTTVNGRLVFVCCPPCIDEIQQSPEQALAKVDANYRAYVELEAMDENDRHQLAAQGICPVSGDALGSKGKPVKVKVGEEHVFLCCRECQSAKLDPVHWAAMQNNLATAQGICPVMEKPVTADMSSTVVKGRKIFVCCPPCIDVIEAEPDKYIAKLDAQIARSANVASDATNSSVPRQRKR